MFHSIPGTRMGGISPLPGGAGNVKDRVKSLTSERGSLGSHRPGTA